MAPSPISSRRLLLGPVPIDVLTFAEALDAVESLVRAGKGGTVFTPNVDHVVNADASPRFRDAYARASLSLVDGMPLVWASRLLGTPLPERVAGADLFEPMIARASQRSLRIYLTGGGPGVAEEAARRLTARHPGLQVVGAEGPRICLDEGPDQSAETVARIRAAKPELVFVGYGSPKQELWIDRYAAELAPAVLLAVGAALDFAAGRARRAPAWVSAVGFEWLYRLAQEPRRLWRRYLVNDPKFLVILARAIRERRFHGMAG
jgi:N-acetylglucosaminyldiphosphoundecaprenol N-acetyl-beta-D-mannosaminyltransferase